MAKQKIKIGNISYQVINGIVHDLCRPYQPLQPRDFLVKKPLVPLLVYLTSKGVSIIDSTGWCKCAAKTGDLEALQWLQAGGAPEAQLTKVGAPWDKYTCAYAAENGHLEVLQWARNAGAPWDEYTCAYAAKYGHLEVLQWARAAGAPWDERVCSNAAYIGHLEVLKWARAAGAPWDDMVCHRAADSGHLEVLQWARSNGAPWNSNACRRAAFKNHIKVLKWAYVNGCPCDDEEEEEVQQLLLKDKDINWSLQCEKRWSKGNQVIDVLLPKYFKGWIEGHREPLRDMIDQVVNECHKVTDDLLPTCLSNLVVTYL